METIVIVPRFVRSTGEFEGRVELFLPYDPVNYGRIMTWHPRDGHNEADWGYYAATRKPWREADEARRLVDAYRHEMEVLVRHSIRDTLPEIRVRQRLPNDWREHAWRTS